MEKNVKLKMVTGLVFAAFLFYGPALWGYEVDENQNKRIGDLERKIKKLSAPDLSAVENEIKVIKEELLKIKASQESISAELKGGKDVVSEAKPEPSGISSAATFDYGVFSKYIWRGWNLFDDPVYQANMGVSQGGISAGISGNYALGDLDRLTELDFTVDLAHSFGIVSCNIGYIQYTFPNVAVGAGRDSAEIYCGFGIDTYAAPSITVYYDFQDGDGTYAELGLSHGFEVHGIGIEPGVALGYNDHQWRAVGSGFSNLDPGISISYSLWKLNATASWIYSFGLDDDYGFKENHGFAGLNIGMEF